jgi:hypothetical protein
MAVSRQAGKPLVITNEADAFRYLQSALADELGGLASAVEFDKWPVISIKLQGKGYDSTVTPHMAVALVDLQAAMNRTYARVIRGSDNPNVLTNLQKQEIEFKAKVKKGSSLVEINLGEYMTTLAQGLAGKMDGNQMVMTVIGLAAVAGSTIAWKYFLKTRSEDRKVDAQTQERIAVSAEETKRMKIMQEVMAQASIVKHASENFDDARHSITKSVGDARTLESQGVELTNAQAKAIASTPRTAALDVQLNGNYGINKLDWTKDGEVRIWLWNTHESLDFSATLNTTTLTTEQKELLKACEWEREVLYFQINATTVRGEVTTARIISVEWPKEPKPTKPS